METDNYSNETGEMLLKGQPMTRSTIVQMLSKSFEQLPEFDRKLFINGPFYLAGNAGLGGLIANSLFRRALNVRHGRLASSLPMAVFPFLTTLAFYHATVSNPLLRGDLNCQICAQVRGTLVSVVGGGIYSILLAMPVNAGLAARYNSAPLPEKGNMLRFWTKLCKTILRRMQPVLLLQTAFGVYLSYKHYEIYLKMLKLSQEYDKELQP